MHTVPRKQAAQPRLAPDAGTGSTRLNAGDDGGEMAAALPHSSHLAQLHALRDQLSARQMDALAHLNTTEHLLASKPRNIDFLKPQEVQLFNEDGRRDLQRQASFMLTVPIADDIALGLDALEKAPETPLPTAARTLLTAQVSAIKQNVDAITATALDEARSELRCCPLTLQSEKFASFLTSQRPAIAEVRSACILTGSERRQSLEKALQQIGCAYLTASGNLPAGLEPGRFVHLDERRFDHAPISLALTDNAQSISVFRFEIFGDTGLILIGADDLDAPDIDPATGSATSRLHARGFEDYDVPQKQAGVYLQKLFVELVHLEELVYLSRHVNKDGTIMEGAPRRTRQETSYSGFHFLGDSIAERGTDPDDRSMRSQRARSMLHLDELVASSKRYRAWHGDDLLVDAALQGWLDDPAFCRDTLTLYSPGARLQLAGMDDVAKILVQTRALTGTS